MAKLSEEISEMVKKNFIHLGFKKKMLKSLQASLKKYIKAVDFSICL